MRPAILFLVAIFSVNILDFPFDVLQNSSAVKSCCCRSGFCHCHHKPGSRCMTKDHKPSPIDGLVFGVSDCGSAGDKAVFPPYSKEFYPPASENFFVDKKPDFFFPQPQRNFSFLFESRLDRPPRIF